MSDTELPRWGHRTAPLAPLAALGGIAVLAGGLAAGFRLTAVAAALLLLGAALLLHAPRLQWRWVVGAIIVVVLVIPIRRYSFGVQLPLDLEPYRLLLAVVLGLWIASLLVDRSTRLRPTGLEGPLALIVVATIGSVVVNTDRVEEVSDNVLKSQFFFITFVLFLYFAVSSFATWRDIDFTVKLLVGGVFALAVSAIIEYRTGWTIFAHLDRYIPFLQSKGLALEDARGGRVRAQASAEHPLSWTGLCLLVAPLSLYLAAVHRRRWLLVGAVIVVAGFSSLSRTAVVMLLVAALVVVWMRPHHVRAEAKTLLVALIPLLIVLKLVVPGVVGTLRYEFSPSEGIVAEQSVVGSADGGRLNDIPYVIDAVKGSPFFGQGYGARLRGQSDGAAVGASGTFDPQGRVLDDQWFGTAVDTGLVAVIGWIWLLVRVIRRMGWLARHGPPEAAWLGVSVNAGLIALSVGMLTFDAFSFVQLTFAMYVVLALACAAWAIAGRDAQPLQPREQT